MRKIILWIPVIVIIILMTFASAQTDYMLYAGANNTEKAMRERLQNNGEMGRRFLTLLAGSVMLTEGMLLILAFL